MGNEKVSKSIEEQKLIPKLEKPHQKTYLTTPMGRFVERASYLDLVIIATDQIFIIDKNTKNL